MSSHANSSRAELLDKQGHKDDSGKLRMDLLPVVPLFLLSDVYTRGAKKYADHNWRKGLKWSRIFAALLRHAWKWFNGERCDPEDGQHHLASVAWCAFTLMEYERSHPEMDDRPEQVPYAEYKKLCADAGDAAVACPKSQCQEDPQALTDEDVDQLARFGFMVRKDAPRTPDSFGFHL